MKMQPMSVDQLLTPAEVAAILFVDPKTVTRWARAGKLDAIRTPGGHRRYLRSDVLAIMTGEHESQHPERPALETGTDDASSGHRPLTASTASDAWPDSEVASEAHSTEAIALALEAEAEQAAAAVVATAAAVTAAAQKAASTAARARAARATASAEAQSRAADRAVREALGQSAASAPWSQSGSASRSGSATTGGEASDTAENAAHPGTLATTARQGDAQVPTQRGS